MTALAAGGGHVPVAVARRSGFDESVHFGSVVTLAADGSVAFAAGDPSVAIYPRSCNKPLQATAMLANGLDVPPEQLALACASHDGSAAHLDAVRAILAGAGLDESALQNTPDVPLDPAEAEVVVRGGGHRSPLQMNCSGKHAAMLATCVVNGWSIDDYLDPGHPLQREITATVAALTGGVAHVGVDGCGAPAHVCTLAGLARAFRSIAQARADVWAAMTAHPLLVGGPTRAVTRLMRGVDGLLAKDGADGVFAAALPDGRALAVKIADGGQRAAPAVVVAALEHLGVDLTGVTPSVAVDVMGHGRPVGEVRAVAFGDRLSSGAAPGVATPSDRVRGDGP